MTSDWFSPDTGGGAERVAYEVARRLATTGHQVGVLATQPTGRPPFDLPGVDLMSVPAYSLSRLLRAQVSVAPSLVHATGKMITAWRPDVVWSHSLQFQTTPFAVAAARFAGIPCVVSAHIGDVRSVRGPVGVAARVHEATIGRAILRLATRAIAVSDPVAAHLRRLDRGVLVDVVPNGVDMARFRGEDPHLHDGLRVGFLGRLVANKGPDIALLAVIEAVRSGIDISISYAGDGPELERLRRLAVAEGVGGRVRFEGYRPDPERWFREVDVLVRPSLTEGMPLGVLEAMAAGVPVIATDIPGNASLLQGGACGLLVPVGNPTALASALERVHRDPHLRADMRRAGLAVAAKMSWGRTAELTLQSLERAIAGVPPVRAPSFREPSRDLD